MNPFQALVARSRRRVRLRVYYDEAYRLPVTGSDGDGGTLETRRADDALHYLLHEHAVSSREVVTPPPATWEDLGRVHTAQWLEALHEPATLARIFALDPSDVFVDGALKAIRAACGGTMAAARFTLKKGRPCLNLLGGFHHAAPDRGSGYCAVNDVAIAVASLRAEGFTGKVAVLDFDFHPPDGTAACLGGQKDVFLASISGASWGPLEGVDETVLPKGAGDEVYLKAVDELLTRTPKVDLAFVLAGGDVLSGDKLGDLGLSLHGTRQRDLKVAHALAKVPQVWLPAGGYGAHAWKVLAGSGLALVFGTDSPVPGEYDPVAARMRGISRSLRTESLGSLPMITEADVADALGLRGTGPTTFVGYYTAQGLEYALERYRILPLLRRLGFEQLHITLDRPGAYDRARLVGRDSTTGHDVVLIELELERRRLGEGAFLFVNWLSLRNPRAHFSARRPQLPGQEVPGLGLAREMTELLSIMARRLVLDGVAFRPSWYHMAYAARHGSRFIDSARQGRFEAMVRDLKRLPLLDVTRAVAEGRARLNGKPYTWEPEEMVIWLDPAHVPADRALVEQERDRCHFTVDGVAAT